MKIYIVFCNGAVECAFYNPDKAIEYIAQNFGCTVNHVINQLECCGSVDDFYYIETTNLY